MVRENSIKFFLSGLVALSGILYELAIAQYLSAILGGTLLQYSLTIGIFTFSLGIAGLIYPYISNDWKNTKGFRRLQIIVMVSAILASLCLNHLNKNQDTSFLFLNKFSYIPAFLLGFLTGLEFPILMEGSDDRQRSFLLAADYFGMFIGTMLFPLFLLPQFGVNGAFLFALSLSAIAAIVPIFGEKCS